MPKYFRFFGIFENSNKSNNSFFLFCNMYNIYNYFFVNFVILGFSFLFFVFLYLYISHVWVSYTCRSLTRQFGNCWYVFINRSACGKVPRVALVRWIFVRRGCLQLFCRCFTDSGPERRDFRCQSGAEKVFKPTKYINM